MDPDKYFSGYILKNAGRKQKFGCARKHAIWMGNFISSPVAYITVDFKKMVSDLFQAGCTLVESNISREKWGYQNSFET